ncbi:MAG: zeta toxin family protein, partial [Bryobacteraceae bacterium]|nr:zeta toxin family protein [Bryobacteraceae bacterium]
VMESLTPGQQVLKIVSEELTELLGGEGAPRLAVPPRPPLVVLLVGLQGSGKTTTAAKLALHLRRRGQRPLLVAADLARPAAAEQLRRLGEKVGVDVFRGGAETPEEVLEHLRAILGPFGP